MMRHDLGPNVRLAPHSVLGALWKPPRIAVGPSRTPKASEEILRPEDLAPHSQPRSLAIMLVGRRGAGKSLGMTALGYFMHRAYARAGGYKKVVSNYWVDFADRVDEYIVDHLNVFPTWGHDLLCLIDEIAAYFPGRRSLARTNVDFATFLQQIRKRRVDLIFTTQFPQVCDQQLLMQIDLFVEVGILRRGCGTSGHRACIELLVHDWWGQWTGLMMPRVWPPRQSDTDWTMVLHRVDSMFGRYNTDEVVAPIWSKRREGIISEGRAGR